jgi:hypothetical protein
MVLLLELVRGRILAQRRKGTRGGALANLAPWREESFPAPPVVGSDLVAFRNGFQSLIWWRSEMVSSANECRTGVDEK